MNIEEFKAILKIAPTDALRVCPVCGKEFHASRSNQKYCSIKCYGKEYYEKNKEKIKAYYEENKEKIIAQSKRVPQEMRDTE